MRIILLILSAVIFISCSNWSSDKDKFTETYKDILIVRLKVQDSVAAEKAVDAVYKKHGFTKSSFKEKYFELAKDHKVFMTILDSARARAKSEIMTVSKSKFKIKGE